MISALKMAAVDYQYEFEKIGFVDIQSVDSSIVVDLKYASADNFMGFNMYGTLRHAYLRPEVAEKLAQAQQLLKKENIDYTLVVYDAARPLSVQKIMYEKVSGTEFSQYVANPYNGGGFHNFGCAVDVTILYKGEPLEMGSHFDSFDELSHTDNEQRNLANGTLSQEAFDNRSLLRRVMTSVGFEVEPCEWWHFSVYKIEYIRKNLPLLEF